MTDTTTQAVTALRIYTEKTSDQGGIWAFKPFAFRHCVFVELSDYLREKDRAAALLSERDALAAALAASESCARESALQALAAYGQAAEAHTAQLAAEAKLATARADALEEAARVVSEAAEEAQEDSGTGWESASYLRAAAAAIRALVKRLLDREELHANRDGLLAYRRVPMCDEAAAALTALQARAEAAEARVRELEAANMRAWEAGRDAAALRIVRHEMGTPMHSPPQLLTEAHDAIMRLTPPASL